MVYSASNNILLIAIAVANVQFSSFLASACMLAVICYRGFFDTCCIEAI